MKLNIPIQFPSHYRIVTLLLFKVENLFPAAIDVRLQRALMHISHLTVPFTFKLDSDVENAKDNVQLQLDVQTAV